jgi:hypothetical protein
MTLCNTCYQRLDHHLPLIIKKTVIISTITTKEVDEDSNLIHLRIMDTIHVKNTDNTISVEWKGDAINDILADSVLPSLLRLNLLERL